jgi:hypothetical protein
VENVVLLSAFSYIKPNCIIGLSLRHLDVFDINKADLRTSTYSRE